MFLERKESTQFQLEENRETAGASVGVQVFQQEKNHYLLLPFHQR